jgi:hypothetical protein
MTSLSRQLCWNSIGAPSHKLAFWHSLYCMRDC